MDVFEAMEERRSVRSFEAGRDVPGELVEEVPALRLPGALGRKTCSHGVSSWSGRRR